MWRLRWPRHVAGIGDRSYAHRIFVTKPLGKYAIRRPRRSWKDNIKMDLSEIDFEVGRWVQLV
jgi:hypothetical protein